MITVSGRKVHADEMQGPFGHVEQQVLTTMDNSETVYHYDSAELLRFELMVRKNIVDSAIALFRSGASFATFDTSRCNPLFWQLTDNGGFRLKENVQPSDAIEDIFQNGQRYAFECATGMVIVYYKATIASIGNDAFNRHFQGIYLRSWHTDRDLVLITRDVRDALAGDVRYFKNPDVHPKHLYFQGENAVDLGDGTYFGHGLGILTAEQTIQALNQFRKPNATKSAFLMNQATRPQINSLAKLANRTGIRHLPENNITIRIGTFEKRFG